MFKGPCFFPIFAISNRTLVHPYQRGQVQKCKKDASEREADGHLDRALNQKATQEKTHSHLQGGGGGGVWFCEGESQVAVRDQEQRTQHTHKTEKRPMKRHGSKKWGGGDS